MTPCRPDRTPDFDALVRKGKELIALGMSGVVYCGSMGDWPLLADSYAAHGRCRAPGRRGHSGDRGHGRGEHADRGGTCSARAEGRCGRPDADPSMCCRAASSAVAQKAHFKALLGAAPDLPAVIYNSPYYGFAHARRPVLRAALPEHPNLCGLQGVQAAKPISPMPPSIITSADPDLTLMVVVSTPPSTTASCSAAPPGPSPASATACRAKCCSWSTSAPRRSRATPSPAAAPRKLEEALITLSTWDAGPDLVLFFKYLLVLNGEPEYELHFNGTDALSPRSAPLPSRRSTALP